MPRPLFSNPVFIFRLPFSAVSLFALHQPFPPFHPLILEHRAHVGQRASERPQNCARHSAHRSHLFIFYSPPTFRVHPPRPLSLILSLRIHSSHHLRRHRRSKLPLYFCLVDLERSVTLLDIIPRPSNLLFDSGYLVTKQVRARITPQLDSSPSLIHQPRLSPSSTSNLPLFLHLPGLAQ